MKPSNVTDFLYNNLSYRAERQKVISSNIANINTPGYKSKDLVFEDELQKASQNSGDLSLTKTHKNHLPQDFKSSISHLPTLLEKKNKVQQNDGNNVSLDEEISEMSKNNVAFEAIQSAIKKDSSWFKIMLDSSGKM